MPATIRCPCSNLNTQVEALLGVLGSRRWFRCRYCGGDFSSGGGDFSSGGK